ncbi:hypothetical protein HCC61_11075 [Streptomyces sp. HNM0575]|uniref:hypothetical protein n=1 Tax=Streptomyces sp. HNM0575 TaxID=2716338 RepID=UPI00145CF3D9|nr:hypothetical protein [Streptomyces sp. HNM0575]NLU73215.1 hypothetical protein [Streptomyces sp. HNM0575]
MVGEAGPELVASSGGDRGITASETSRMLNTAARGGGSAGSGGLMTGTLASTGPVTLPVGGEEFEAYLDGQARATIGDVIHEATTSR